MWVNRGADVERTSAFGRRNRLVSAAAIAAGVIVTSPASAAECQYMGAPLAGGIEPPLAVDAACADPDYNEKTFLIDSTEQKSLDLPGGATIGYTEVKGHFPPTRTKEQLPSGVTQSPTTAKHGVTWRFPEKQYWRNRFFQHTYPLPMDFLNTVDARFAFTSGGYTVGITPGSPNVGYRVPAAAAKLAKSYANKLYGNTARIYGYMYGQSGGSVQTIGAAEGTTGVWDGIIPVVIATDGLNAHSFQWGGLYAVAVPAQKRDAIAAAVVPGSDRDIYAGLNSDERAILDELLNAGFARVALEDMKFNPASALQGSGPVATFDPTYEDDFWSKPGYEGVAPPEWLKAAVVDGYATITGITRNAKGVPTAITFAPGTVPRLGSIGDAGLQYYVYRGDGTTRVTSGEARTLSGKLSDNTLTLSGTNDPALLNALAPGGMVRINNRFLLASIFYPRHSILDNGSPAYNQYKNADGTPKYVQRAPSQLAYFGNIRSAGGRRQAGRLQVKTMVLENLVDPASYPYVAGFYEQQVRRAMGSGADKMFRVYYQESASHGLFPEAPPGKLGTSLVANSGILHQAMLDLAAWAERGTAPLPSTRYSFDAMNQVILPKQASQRRGLQPVVHLTANGSDRAEVAVNEPVTLVGRIEMPPRAGKVVNYDWYLGGSDYKFEPITYLSTPQLRVEAKRTVSFPAPGEYMVTLRTAGQREGMGDPYGTTLLQNADRVRVVVR